MIARWLMTAALALAGAADPLLLMLPGEGFAPGWQSSGEARLFVGSELYRHIDGGAVLYQEAGFDRLAVQSYARGNLQLQAEIYRMNDASGAASVFAELSRGLATDAAYGEACTRDDYQIGFRRGRFLVSLTVFEPGAETRQALAALAAHIDRALKESLL